MNFLKTMLFRKKMTPAKPLSRQALAKIGETAAARLLAGKGYQVLEQNVRTRRGEIDLVARQGQDIVFVEVKARTSEKFGRPAEAIIKSKQRRIAALAAGYVAQHFHREVNWRFDVVEIWLTPEGKVTKTNLIPGAFRPE
jgi:putative endonuclease